MTAKKIRHTATFKKNSFEKSAWQAQSIVCGIDEVGRGCLAGPVVTAAVILPPGRIPRIIKDSKVLNEAERLKANTWIIKNCRYSYGIVHNRAIDKYNIWHATLIAMKRALINVLSIHPERPTAILVDAMPLKLDNTSYTDIPVHHFPFGESRSSSIAAASIIAKVKRDAMMKRLELVFPGYKLGQHKGYSTKTHKECLVQLNKTIIHRDSFLSKVAFNNEHESEFQQTLC